MSDDMSAITGDGDPFGVNNSVVDVSRAVLLDDVEVVIVGTANAEGAGRVIGMELSGKVNKTPLRSSVLYLFDEDGAATIISELLGLAHRVARYKPESRDQ